METGSESPNLAMAVINSDPEVAGFSGLLEQVDGKGVEIVASIAGWEPPTADSVAQADAVMVLLSAAAAPLHSRAKKLIEHLAGQWPVVVGIPRLDELLELELLRNGAEECIPAAGATSAALVGAVRRSVERRRCHSKRERERVNRTLRDSEALYHSLVETLTQNILRKDLEGRFTFASSNFCKTIGKPLDEILGKTDHDLFPAELALKYRADDRGVIESGQTFETEEEHTTPEGKHFVVKVVKTPVTDSTGRIIGTQGIFWDITEQKRAQAELASSRERFALAVRGSTDGIWDWNVLTGEVYYSSRYKELLGYGPDGEHGHVFNNLDAFESLLHPDDRESWAQTLDAHLNEREPFDAEFRLLCASGEYRWFHARAEAVRNDNGKATRMAGSISDINERKHAEEALRVRTAELEKSNHDLEQFAYIASHDLKEPLRMVSSYVQLLERRYSDQLDDDAREFIGYAVSGARRMKTLIEDLLVYSRVGTKGKELVAVDSSEAFRAAMENLGVAIRENDAVVNCGSLPTVRGDVVQLTQLFQNLIGNAIKFRGESAPVVAVAARRDGEFWRFTVSDNGIGIDQGHSERIFEIFQRLHDRAHYEGTGIGLAVARKIVERHGGEISVESTPGAGSIFSFTLSALADGERTEGF